MPEVTETVRGRPDLDCLVRVEVSVRGKDGETNLAVLEDLVEATDTVIDDHREERLETDGGQIETGRRARVAITTVADDHRARVTSTERLEQLLEALERWGPEPEGIVVSVDRDALDELPPAWKVEHLRNPGPVIRCDDCGRTEDADELEAVAVLGLGTRLLCRRCR